MDTLKQREITDLVQGHTLSHWQTKREPMGTDAQFQVSITGEHYLLLLKYKTTVSKDA